MDTYTSRLEKIHELAAQPLVVQRAHLGENGRLATPEKVVAVIGGEIQSAGMAFLESIHQEIFNSKTKEEQRAELIDKGLLELPFDKQTAANAKPEPKAPYIPLGEGKESDEYLASLGIDPYFAGSTKTRMTLEELEAKYPESKTVKGKKA